MGHYIVNGEMVSVEEQRPTAGDLKKHAKAVASDWVMANMPNGDTVQLPDHHPLPAEATDYSLVPVHKYGRAY